MHSNRKRTVPCMGLLTGRGNSHSENSRVIGDSRRGNVHVTSLKWNRYFVVMSYGWFTQSLVWDNPLYMHIIHPYSLNRMYLFHYSDMIWAPSCLKSPVTRLFVHVLLLLDNKWKSQSSPYCPVLRGIYLWLVHSRHKGRVMRKVLPCHDVIIGT